MMPGAILSLAGIGLYWWSTGFTEPGALFMVFGVTAGVIALLTDWFGGAFTAKAGGASNRTMIAAGIAGFLLFFVAGPIGILVGTGGVVFLRESMRTGNRDKSAKAALYSTLGVLGSSIVQFSMTVAILIGFIVAVII